MARIDTSGFIESLTEEQFKAGCIKFNIPDEDRIESKNGEGVWGWVTPEDKAKYNDDTFCGKMKAILLNVPLNYFPRLKWGTEVVIKCHGPNRPTLDPKWVHEELLMWEPLLEVSE